MTLYSTWCTTRTENAGARQQKGNRWPHITSKQQNQVSVFHSYIVFQCSVNMMKKYIKTLHSLPCTFLQCHYLWLKLYLSYSCHTCPPHGRAQLTGFGCLRFVSHDTITTTIHTSAGDLSTLENLSICPPIRMCNTSRTPQ